MESFMDSFESIIIAFGIPVAVLMIIFGAIVLIVKYISQRKERQILAEQGIVPSKAKAEKRSNAYAWLRSAGLVLGLGVGFLVGSFFAMCPQAGLYLVACLLIFAGLGMIGGFMLERKLRKADKSEEML